MLQSKTFPVITWQAAGGEVPLALLSVLPDDKEGAHPVIRSIDIKVVMDLSTAAGVTSYGANVAKAVKMLTITDGQGDLVKLSGPQLRVKDIENNGERANADVADIAANTANQLRTMWLTWDFQPRNAKRRKDFGLPARALKYVPNAGIILNVATAAEMGFTGGNPTVNSMYYYVTVHFELVPDLVLNTRRECKSVLMQDYVNLSVPAQGKSLRSVILFKPADSARGGTDLSAMTSIDSEAFRWSAVDPLLFQRYLLAESKVRHNPASTTDPFVPAAYQAFSLIHPKEDQKTPDLPIHDGTPLVVLNGQNVATLPVIYDVVTDRSEDSTLGDAQVAGKAAPTIQVKTAGKTKRDPAAWSDKVRKRLPAKLK
jgi:hypothetical protein